jgi:hypothetical protein
MRFASLYSLRKKWVHDGGDQEGADTAFRVWVHDEGVINGESRLEEWS